MQPLVKTGDKVQRGDTKYEVLIADDNIFVLGRIRFKKKEGCFCTSYESAEIYSNCFAINSLEDLNMRIVEQQ